MVTIYGQAQAELLAEALKLAGKNLTREGVVKAAEGIKNFKDSLKSENADEKKQA